ncbi:hypothetical protein [Sphingomonas sp. MMS24-J13]|uniref:hypothetical protein n=1 Tax=Sphingomonas sp. MMS24-J13 TaxID=3238686 RepID=UPI003850E7DC
MDLDHLLTRFFGTADLATLSADQMGSGIEQLRLRFGLEKDRGRRFALWSLMYMLGVSPDLDVAFKTEEDRNAARDFMDMADRAGDEGANA